MDEFTTPGFGQWLDQTYRDGTKGSDPKFTKWNMEVAYRAGQESVLTAAPDSRIESAIRKLRIIKRDFCMKGANATTLERAIDLMRSFARRRVAAPDKAKPKRYMPLIGSGGVWYVWDLIDGDHLQYFQTEAEAEAACEKLNAAEPPMAKTHD